MPGRGFFVVREPCPSPPETAAAGTGTTQRAQACLSIETSPDGNLLTIHGRAAGMGTTAGSRIGEQPVAIASRASEAVQRQRGNRSTLFTPGTSARSCRRSDGFEQSFDEGCGGSFTSPVRGVTIRSAIEESIFQDPTEFALRARQASYLSASTAHRKRERPSLEETGATDDSGRGLMNGRRRIEAAGDLSRRTRR